MHSPCALLPIVWNMREGKLCAFSLALYDVVEILASSENMVMPALAWSLWQWNGGLAISTNKNNEWIEPDYFIKNQKARDDLLIKQRQHTAIDYIMVRSN